MLRLTPKLPRRVNQEILNRFAKPGEAMVILKVCHVGDISPFDLLDENGTSFIFRWDNKLGGHALRIPLSLWMDNNAALAHCLLDHRALPFPLVPLFEVPAPVPASAPFEFESEEEKPSVIEMPVAVADEPTEVCTAPIPDQITNLASQKPIRVKELAEKLGITEDALKEELAKPESKAELGHAGWVKLKAPAEA